MRTTVNEKAAALQERFYPIVAADLANITNLILTSSVLDVELYIKRIVAD